MYAIEDVKAYLNAEGIVEKPVSEINKSFSFLNSKVKENPSRIYFEAAAKEGGIVIYDFLKSIYREGIEWRLMQLQDLLGDTNGSYVLDAGCATGLEAIFLGNRMTSGHIYGFDIVPEMIDAALERKSRYPTSRARFGAANNDDLPLGKAFFDHAFAFNSLSESPTDDRLMNARDMKKNSLRGVARVLKPSGNLIVASQYSGILGKLGAIEVYEQDLEKSGFKVIDVREKEQTFIIDKMIGDFIIHAKKIRDLD